MNHTGKTCNIVQRPTDHHEYHISGSATIQKQLQQLPSTCINKLSAISARLYRLYPKKTQSWNPLESSKWAIWAICVLRLLSHLWTTNHPPSSERHSAALSHPLLRTTCCRDCELTMRSQVSMHWDFIFPTLSIVVKACWFNWPLLLRIEVVNPAPLYGGCETSPARSHSMHIQRISQWQWRRSWIALGLRILGVEDRIVLHDHGPNAIGKWKSGDGWRHQHPWKKYEKSMPTVTWKVRETSHLPNDAALWMGSLSWS